MLGQFTQPSPINHTGGLLNVLERRVGLSTGPPSHYRSLQFPSILFCLLAVETILGRLFLKYTCSPRLLNPLSYPVLSADQHFRVLAVQQLEWLPPRTDGRRFRLSTARATRHGHFQNITLVTPLCRQIANHWCRNPFPLRSLGK